MSGSKSPHTQRAASLREAAESPATPGAAAESPATPGAVDRHQAAAAESPATPGAVDRHQAAAAGPAAAGPLSPGHEAGDGGEAAAAHDAAEARGESADGGAELLQEDIDELAALAAQRDEYLALAQRTQADFENYRKRTAREARAAETRGIARLAKELLPALDNLDLALSHAAEDDPLLEGVRLVHAELVAALGRMGIEGFSPIGERFDPSQHEAMAQHPVEHADSGTVVEVYQQGYLLGDAVIRPARVVVAA